MKIDGRFILFFPFVLLAVSCSRDFNKMSTAFSKQDKGTYTSAQVDSVAFSIFKINGRNFQPCPGLKYEGAYVCAIKADKHKKAHYHVLKFTDSGLGYRGSETYDLNPDSIARDYGAPIRYSMQNGGIVYENLTWGFLKIRDVFMYGKISDNGDTLSFYKVNRHGNINKLKQGRDTAVFVYDPGITSIPGAARPKK